MPTVTHGLTLEEFRTRYADEKPYYEYWFGEAVQKSVPTWLHSVLQAILCDVLREAGYKSGPEVELRSDRDWQPKPDVIGAFSVEHPYPTKPVEIVAEILAPEDKMARVFEKCRQYERIGISQIFVFDPEAQKAWEWSRETKNLEHITELQLENGYHTALRFIWDQLEKRR